MLSLSENAEFKKPKMFAVAGILFALIGVVSFFTCWFIIHDYELKNLSGLDMIPDSSIFAYLPLVIMIISVINIVAFAYIGCTHQKIKLHILHQFLAWL